MIKIVNKEKFEKVYKKYSLYSNDKFAISKMYPKGFAKNYVRDILEPFKDLLLSILGIVVFPIQLVVVLYRFLPRLIILKIDDTNE